jgi:hypothetical protein
MKTPESTIKIIGRDVSLDQEKQLQEVLSESTTPEQVELLLSAYTILVEDIINEFESLKELSKTAISLNESMSNPDAMDNDNPTTNQIHYHMDRLQTEINGRIVRVKELNSEFDAMNSKIWNNPQLN